MINWQDILYHAVPCNIPPSNWRNCFRCLNAPRKLFYVLPFEQLTFAAFWKLIHSHAVTPCWLGDAKECIQSGWSKQCEWCFLKSWPQMLVASKAAFLMEFAKCNHILKGFKVFQRSRNCFKYSEKQICFSHENLYNLHLLSNSFTARRFYNRNKLEIYFEAEF